MHQSERNRHHQNGANDPALCNMDDFGKINFSTNGQPDADDASDDGLRSRRGDSEECRQGYEKSRTNQCNTNGEIVQIGFDDTFADRLHDMLPLENGADNGENGNQQGSIPEAYQAATHRCANTVGSVICADIPADVSTGSQQY